VCVFRSGGSAIPHEAIRDTIAAQFSRFLMLIILMPIFPGYQDGLIVVLDTIALPAHDRTQAALGSGVVFRIKM
jgi:hypothetical protein